MELRLFGEPRTLLWFDLRDLSEILELGEFLLEPELTGWFQIRNSLIQKKKFGKKYETVLLLSIVQWISSANESNKKARNNEEAVQTDGATRQKCRIF